MSSSSVWVQLFYEGKDEPKGQPVEIEPIPRNIGALAKATKAELKPKIDYAPLDEIFVFSPGTKPPFSQDKAIDPGENVPTATTSKNPLIVVAPDPATETETFMEPQQNKKQKFEFIDQLVLPAEIVPPKVSIPTFVSPPSWREKVKAEIVHELSNWDDPQFKDNKKDYLTRVPPMGLVRCSRGGKTRALYEIANMMKNHELENEPGLHVACIYVTFNDYSSLEDWEQENPLQALLRRIAFAALPPPTDSSESSQDRFSKFSRTKPVWELGSFQEWIGKTPCILLVDELNNLNKLTEENSTEAAEFGFFLKTHFIGMKNRYMVFSSHLLGTSKVLQHYIDRSNGSSRSIILQELPLVPSLAAALGLKKNLSAREAVYYGLIPGIIYESAQRGSIAGKRDMWVEKAIKNHKHELDVCFCAILASLIDGETDGAFPQELVTLLDSVPVEGLDFIRWVPFHLQFVLEELGDQRFKHHVLAQRLAGLCNLLIDSKELSGEGWEGLFVLFLVARCLNNKSDGVFVPHVWFERPSGETVEVVLNNYDPSKNEDRSIGHCKNWNELKAGVVPGSNNRCLNILYPTHNNFEVYDVIVVQSIHRSKDKVWGYQLKQGKAGRKHHAYTDMHKSLFVQGDAPQKTKDNDGKGWTIPSKDAIDTFFGVSGKHWTPARWKEFEESDP